MAIGNELWYEPELFASGQRKDFSRGAYQEDATNFDAISAIAFNGYAWLGIILILCILYSVISEKSTKK